MRNKLKQKRIKWTKSYTNYAVILGAMIIFILIQLTGNLSRGVNSILITTSINIILAVSLSLVVGFLGELSLGHAGFMCVGAFMGKYTSNLLVAAGWGNIPAFIVALIVGGLVAAVFGAIIGLPTMRLNGDYLAIVTLAFGEIIRNVIMSMDMFGAAQGLKGRSNVITFVLCFIFILITLFVIQNLINSKHGRAIKAVRDNTIAARSIGLNVNAYKLWVFIISAFFAGIAGVLYGHNLYILKSITFGYNKSIEILVFVVLGGMDNILGVIIATTILTVLPEALRFLSDYRMMIYALLLIIMMIANESPRAKAFLGGTGDKFKALFTNMFKSKGDK